MIRGRKSLACLLSAVAVVSTVASPLSAYANTSSNFAYRRQVIALSGIMPTTGGMAEKVTRAQFAEMLVRASAYRSVLTKTSNVSVFADVKSGDAYAASIRLAAEQGWMTGYLGGKFKPSEPVRLNEAAKGVLGLLGYTAEDFAGDQFNKRMAQYANSDLNENIGYSDPQTELTKADCVNLFYNLLKAKQKSGTVYAGVLNAEVDSNGEVNALKMADNTTRGPKVAESRTQVDNIIPFRLDDATIFMNGREVQKEALYAAAAQYAVIYYSSQTKTVWAYNADTDSDADKRVARGVVEAIYYQNTNTLTPSAVKLDDGNVYQLNSTEMQFVFSVYGSVKVGDHVVLIYQVAGNGAATEDGEASQSFSVVDYVEP
jgi:putative middle wall protein (fragment)